MNDPKPTLLLTPEERSLLLDHLTLPPGMLARLRFAVHEGKILRIELNLEEMQEFLLCVSEALCEDCDLAFVEALNAIIDRNIPPEALEGLDDMEEMALPDLPPRELLDTMRAIAEGHDSPEAADTAVQAFVEEHNNTPQASFLGLTPRQMMAIFQVDWISPESSIRLLRDMDEGDLEGSDMARNGMHILAMIGKAGHLPVTGKGGLNRKTILQIAAETTWHRTDIEDTLTFYSTPNEIDLFPIHVLRTLLQMAKLIRRVGNRVVLTKAGELIVAERRFGELQNRLFIVFCDEFNVGYLDGLPDYPGIGNSYPFILYALGQRATEPTSVITLIDQVFLDDILNSFEETSEPPDAVIALFTRVIWPLQDFGILTVILSPDGAPRRADDEIQVQISPLFHKMFRFAL